MKKKILIISFSDLKSDPRVNRQIRTLHRIYDVIGAGTGNPDIPGVHFIELKWGPKKWPEKLIGAGKIGLGAYDSFYWGLSSVKAAHAALRGVEFDLILANDVDTLALAVEIAGKKPVFFDAHEYSPLEAEERLIFRTLIRPFRTFLLKKYLPRVAAMSTVCQTISEKYEKEFGVRSEVITNAPDYQELQPILRDSGPVRIVHHGMAHSSRKLEWTIDVMNQLDSRFQLSFLLVGDPGYIDQLKKKAAANPRISFLDPVPMRQLSSFLNQFDIGLFLLPDSNFNYRYALPNKFFEFVQARLALAIGPSPEMARTLSKYELGVSASDYSPAALAGVLSELTWEKINEFKRNAHKHALELSANPNSRKLIDITSKLLTPSGS